ncbi:MAG TPA: type 4a pilus biogenesis protein PilO [Candidatus Omnitrophota bacterium]|nr:type 4a pilus biogenesis protein PilO [Candidatus Omnitrophota bacterium]HPS20739.1 type 4a pilus biogenesis protein PilO [Candidatus Omnitrophota bacterium]
MVNVEQIKVLWKDKLIRKYMLGGVVLFVALFYFLFILIPQFAALAKVSFDINEMTKKIKIVNDKANNIGALENKLKQTKEQYEKESKYFPAQKEITGLLEGFAAVATKSEVKILSITPYDLKPIDKSGGEMKYYREMPIMITAKSGYHQLGNFISNLENEKRIINIEDLQIKYDASSPRMHNVVIMMKTYVSIEDEGKSEKQGKK